MAALLLLQASAETDSDLELCDSDGGERSGWGGEEAAAAEQREECAAVALVGRKKFKNEPRSP